MLSIMRRSAISALVALVTAIPASGSAVAATQIGQTFTPDSRGCAAGFTWLQYTVLNDGVITTWSFEGSAIAGQVPSLKFKVARRVQGNDYEVTAESGLVAPAIGTLSKFPVQAPVRAGDLIGFFTQGAGYCDRPLPGDTELLNGPVGGDLAPPGTATFTPTDPFGASTMNRQLDLSAMVEPDCDRDGLGDETQDGNLSSCPTCKGKRSTIVGTRHNDDLGGTQGRDVMAGLEGNDKLFGYGGNDLICGGRGKDQLSGGNGKDALLGQKGRDACKGGKGRDSAKGCEKWLQEGTTPRPRD